MKKYFLVSTILLGGCKNPMLQSSSSATLVPTHANANFVLGTSNGKLIFNCHLDANKNIICPNDAQVVNALSDTDSIAGIALDGNNFYVNNKTNSRKTASLVQCLRTDPITCRRPVPLTLKASEGPSLVHNGYIYTVSRERPFLEFCKINPNGSIKSSCKTNPYGLQKTAFLSIKSFHDKIFISQEVPAGMHRCTQDPNYGTFKCESKMYFHAPSLFISDFDFYTSTQNTNFVYQSLHAKGLSVRDLDEIDNPIQTIATTSFDNGKPIKNVVHHHDLYITTEEPSLLYRCSLNSATGTIEEKSCTKQGDLKSQFEINGKIYIPTVITFY
jgi:hypothetical protein